MRYGKHLSSFSVYPLSCSSSFAILFSSSLSSCLAACRSASSFSILPSSSFCACCSVSPALSASSLMAAEADFCSSRAFWSSSCFELKASCCLASAFLAVQVANRVVHR